MFCKMTIVFNTTNQLTMAVWPKINETSEGKKLGKEIIRNRPLISRSYGLAAAVVAQFYALLAQFLQVLFSLVTHSQVT